MVIDNVSTLLTYNTIDSIKRFFDKYSQVVRAARPVGLQTLIAMDRDQHPDLFKFIAGLSRKSIELGPDMLVKNISAADMPMPVPPQATPAPSISSNAEQGILRDKEVM